MPEMPTSPDLRSVVLGAVGATVAWFLVEFVGRPFRQFFDLRREVSRCLVQYANVRPRAVAQPDGTRPTGISPHDDEYLRKAEAAFRDLASQMQAFAQAEYLANKVVRLFGFNAYEASSMLFGYSNEIGTSGLGREEYRSKLLKLLRIKEWRAG